MLARHRVFELLPVVILVALAGLSPAQQKAPPKAEVVKIAGILFDYDRKNNWLTVKGDGEDAPVKYLLDPSNKALLEAMQSIFGASRVRLAYRMEGDSRRLVGIQRQVLQDSGVVTGVVVAVHNNFWIELKPKNGVANAFAPGANYNDAAFMAKLKSLKPGDSVTIQFNTDFERHRILAMRKNATPAPPASKKPAQGSPAKAKS